MPANPPTIDREPYERVADWTETAFSAPYVTVEAHNAVYEDPEFLASVEPLMADAVDQSPRALFTTALGFEPALPGEKTTDRLLSVSARYARREFRTSLSEDGLRSVEDTGAKDLRLRGRRTAKAFQYDAGYPLAEEAPGDEATLPVRVWAAIWPTADSFAMAGGIYPLEDLTGGAVSIAARPGGDRRAVLDAIRDAAN